MEELEGLKQKVTYLQEQLNRQEKMASLGLLSAGIAHEIQNPLNFVINFSKMSVKLLDDLQEIVNDCADKLGEDDAADMKDISADLADNLQKIQEHGERAISIIRGILLMSRGKENEFLPTDVCHLVKEYVWLAYHAMRANDKSFNISIKENYQQGIPQLMVIPQDLSRAVLNVVNNACYAVRQRSIQEGEAYQPTIEIEVSASDVLKIQITDNGIGMSDEVKQRLYDNFFTTKPVGQGTGLGMGITRDIIENKHHGNISFESKEGQGTRFTFTIPITK